MVAKLRSGQWPTLHLQCIHCFLPPTRDVYLAPAGIALWAGRYAKKTAIGGADGETICVLYASGAAPSGQRWAAAAPPTYRMDAGEQPATPVRQREVTLLESPTFELSPQQPALSQQLTGYLAEIVHAVNTLREDQAELTGRTVGIEAA